MNWPFLVWFAGATPDFSMEPPERGKQKRIRPLSRDSDFRNEKSAQRGALGRTFLQTSGQRLRSGPPNPGKARNVARTSRVDVHEKIRSEIFGLILVPQAPKKHINIKKWGPKIGP